MPAVRYGVLLIPILFIACGGGSPNSPSTVDSPGGGYRGEAVSAIGGGPLPGVNVKIGSKAVVTDDRGYFEIASLKAGSETLVLSGSSIVERQKMITVPRADISRETLIPASFDLAAFDEMFRGSGRLHRWKTAPTLVIIAKVMQYDATISDDYRATSESLTQDEIDLLAAHLTEGLGLLTGGTFTSFASIEIENPDVDAKVSGLRPGKIVIGRYRGVQILANTIGYGRHATTDSGEVTGGTIYLDRNFDRNDDMRRLLRIHELGHALGYRHVTVRTSIMNPAIGPQPTEFDRMASQIAFQREPGNQSPDNDAGASGRPGGIFGVRTSSPIAWTPPVVCAP